MAADLADVPAAREVLDAADRTLGFALTDLMFGDDAEALKPTEVTQPALYVHSLAANAALAARGVRPDLAAGHSLGEWSALTAVGALTFEDGLRAVRRRGEQRASAHLVDGAELGDHARLGAVRRDLLGCQKIGWASDRIIRIFE